MLDPLSMKADWPLPPRMPERLSCRPDCCLTVSTMVCAPPGLAAALARTASSPGTAALIPLCASLRVRPSAEAMRAIMSGVRNYMMIETRLVPMGTSLLALVPSCCLLPMSLKPTYFLRRLLTTPFISPANLAANWTQPCAAPRGNRRLRRLEGRSASPERCRPAPGLGPEHRQLVEFFREQVVEGDTRLVAVALHPAADLHDRLVELGVGIGETELFPQERFAHAVALALVGQGAEAGILFLQRDAEVLDAPFHRRIHGLRGIPGHVGRIVMGGRRHGSSLLLVHARNANPERSPSGTWFSSLCAELHRLAATSPSFGTVALREDYAPGPIGA